jgi:hypothetical protein
MILSGLLLAVSVQAQEADELSAIGPGVDTSTYDAEEPAVDTSATTVDSERVDADEAVVNDEPAVPDDRDREISTNGDVMDRMTLGRTEITGNQELPKVMYIVPWKKSDPGDLMGRPVNTLLDEVLAPVNREEFIRQVGYYNDLYVSDENLSSP